VVGHADRLRVVALAAGGYRAPVEQVARFSPDTIAMSTPRAVTPPQNSPSWRCAPAQP
jgi:hypothetical protein